MLVVVKQPVDSVYVITVVPNVWPLTIPVREPTLATDGVLLAHVPPPKSVSVVLPVIHTSLPPDIGNGNGSIIIVLVIGHPVVGAE